MRKLLFIFATILGLGLAACDTIDPSPGNQTETPEKPDGNEEEEKPKPEEPEEKEFVILFTNDFHSLCFKLNKPHHTPPRQNFVKRILNGGKCIANTRDCI